MDVIFIQWHYGCLFHREYFKNGLNGSGLNKTPVVIEATAVFFREINKPLRTNVLNQKTQILNQSLRFKEAKKKRRVKPACPIFL